MLLSLTRSGARLVSDLREGSYSLLRRWMGSLAPDDLQALSRGWRALAGEASRHGHVRHHGQVLEDSAV